MNQAAVSVFRVDARVVAVEHPHRRGIGASRILRAPERDVVTSRCVHVGPFVPESDMEESASLDASASLALAPCRVAGCRAVVGPDPSSRSRYVADDTAGGGQISGSFEDRTGPYL